LFGVRGRKWLRSLELPIEEPETVRSALRRIAFLDREISEVERLIAKRLLHSADARRLMTVPGVNLIATATFLAAVGDIGRFSSSRRLVACLGLDPKVRRSGEQPARSGRIGRRGSASARWALVEAAWSVVCQPGPLRAYYQRIRARRGHGTAIVAAARKLAVLFWCLLTRGEDVADRPEAPAARADRRRAGAQRQALRRLGHARENAPRREPARRPGTGLLRADRPRLAGRHRQQSGRERDSGARIRSGPRRATSRGRPASSRRLRCDSSSTCAHTTTQRPSPDVDHRDPDHTRAKSAQITPIGAAAGRTDHTEGDPRPPERTPRAIQPPKTAQIPSNASAANLDFLSARVSGVGRWRPTWPVGPRAATG
jgi:hypothetical protein